MKYEYLRIDMIQLIEYNDLFNWLHEAPDCEYREDYQCFFILKGSKAHTWVALHYPKLITDNPWTN